MSTSPDTTQLLIDASAGDEEAVGELLDHVYDELRQIAHRERIDLDGAQIPVESRGDVLLALDEALSRLSSVSKRLGSVVEYRFFGGMTQAEIGIALGLDERTVRRDWRKARAYLANELRG